MANILKIKRNGPVPMMEIVVGHAHFGQYQVGRYPSQTDVIKVRSGDNVDNVPDVFALATKVADLDNNLLVWGVLVVAYSTSSDPYSVTVIIRQDGIELDRDVRRGNLASGMAAEVGEWQLQLV